MLLGIMISTSHHKLDRNLAANSALTWQAAKAPKAIMVIVHGLGEHGGRYTQMMADFAGHNIASLAIDLPGHGQRAGARGKVSDYQQLLDCVSAGITAARKRFGDLPLFLYGHSMGGAVVLAYGLKDFPDKQNDICAFLCSAPLIRPAKPVTLVLRAVTKLLRPILPGLVLKSGLDSTKISTLETEQNLYADDPLNHDKIGIGLAVDIIEMGEWIEANAQNWDAPLLLMHARGDRLTSFKASENFAVKARRCTFIAFDGAEHEIHNDITRAAVYTAMRGFIEAQL